MQGHPPTPGAAWRNKITRSTITLFLPQRAPTRKELLSSPHSFTQVPCWTMFSASRGMEVEGDYLSVSWEGPRGSSSPGRWLDVWKGLPWTGHAASYFWGSPGQWVAPLKPWASPAQGHQPPHSLKCYSPLPFRKVEWGPLSILVSWFCTCASPLPPLKKASLITSVVLFFPKAAKFLAHGLEGPLPAITCPWSALGRRHCAVLALKIFLNYGNYLLAGFSKPVIVLWHKWNGVCEI